MSLPTPPLGWLLKQLSRLKKKVLRRNKEPRSDEEEPPDFTRVVHPQEVHVEEVVVQPEAQEKFDLSPPSVRNVLRPPLCDV